jgi:hypothetical protein
MPVADSGRADSAPELKRRLPGVTPKEIGEMALVGEPCGQRDLCQRYIGVGKLTSSMVDSQAANVLSHSATERTAERSSKGDRVNSH